MDLSSLDEYARLLKSKTGIIGDDSRRKTLSIPKDSLVPIIQADVGSNVSVDVFRYRLLVPIAQIIAETSGEFERIAVASISDIFTIEKAFVRHFGGATVHLQEPSPIRGVGARDPSDVAGTTEQNEHVIFEVYAHGNRI